MDGFFFFALAASQSPRTQLMQLVLHSKDTTRRILKPKVMRSFYQQLSRGHVYIDFIK